MAKYLVEMVDRKSLPISKLVQNDLKLSATLILDVF